MISTNRRTFLTISASSVLSPLLFPQGVSAAQLAQTRLVSGFAPGGTTDTVCRVAAERMKNGDYADVVLVDNRSGANGQLALKYVKTAPPDGSVMLMTPDSIVAVHPHIYPDLDVDPLTDYEPVSLAAFTVDAFAIGPLVPESVRTLDDFLAWCKANPTQANFGTPGAGSVLHFIGALLSKESGVPMQHIQYRGSQPAIVDMIGGQIAATSVPVGEYLRHLPGGKVRMLATTGSERSRFAPDVPTFTEQGFKSLQVDQWMAFFLPAKTPKDIVTEANKGLRDAFTSKAAAEALATFGMEPATSTPEELADRLRADYDRWGQVVKATNFKFG